jgi:hypothetical protein
VEQSRPSQINGRYNNYEDADDGSVDNHFKNIWEKEQRDIWEQQQETRDGFLFSLGKPLNPTDGRGELVVEPHNDRSMISQQGEGQKGNPTGFTHEYANVNAFEQEGEQRTDWLKETQIRPSPEPQYSNPFLPAMQGSGRPISSNPFDQTEIDDNEKENSYYEANHAESYSQPKGFNAEGMNFGTFSFEDHTDNSMPAISPNKETFAGAQAHPVESNATAAIKMNHVRSEQEPKNSFRGANKSSDSINIIDKEKSSKQNNSSNFIGIPKSNKSFSESQNSEEETPKGFAISAFKGEEQGVGLRSNNHRSNDADLDFTRAKAEATSGRGVNDLGWRISFQAGENMFLNNLNADGTQMTNNNQQTHKQNDFLGAPQQNALSYKKNQYSNDNSPDNEHRLDEKQRQTAAGDLFTQHAQDFDNYPNPSLVTDDRGLSDMEITKITINDQKLDELFSNRKQEEHEELIFSGNSSPLTSRQRQLDAKKGEAMKTIGEYLNLYIDKAWVDDKVLLTFNNFP